MRTASTPHRGPTKAPHPRGDAAAPSRRRRHLAWGVAIAACAGTLTFWASSGSAATPLTDYSTNLTRVESPNPQPGGQWAQRIRTVADLNGDGKNEILVADYRESFGGFERAGRVYMLDGATRSVLYFIDSPQIQANAQFGFVPAVIGDVNGDGKADFVAGADGQDTLADGTACTPPASGPTGTCNQDQGKAWVFSGANGQTLYELNMPKPPASVDSASGQDAPATSTAMALRTSSSAPRQPTCRRAAGSDPTEEGSPPALCPQAAMPTRVRRSSSRAGPATTRAARPVCCARSTCLPLIARRHRVVASGPAAFHVAPLAFPCKASGT